MKLILGLAAAAGMSSPAWWRDFLANQCRSQHKCAYLITDARAVCAECSNAGLAGWAPFAIGSVCLIVLGGMVVSALSGI